MKTALVFWLNNTTREVYIRFYSYPGAEMFVGKLNGYGHEVIGYDYISDGKLYPVSSFSDVLSLRNKIKKEKKTSKKDVCIDKLINYLVRLKN